MLVDIHPGDSALILQIKERLSKERMPVFNTFSRFDTAYNNIDLWPGVLLWDENDSVFVKVDEVIEIINIFEILRFEKRPFRYFKDLSKRKIKKLQPSRIMDIRIRIPNYGKAMILVRAGLRNQLNLL